MNTTEQTAAQYEWLREGNLLYTLVDQPYPRAGLPKQVNGLTIRVDAYALPDGTAKGITDRLEAFLLSATPATGGEVAEAPEWAEIANILRYTLPEDEQIGYEQKLIKELQQRVFVHGGKCLGEVEVRDLMRAIRRREMAALSAPATAAPVWVPVAELKGRDENEWFHVLLPNGKVEPAIYTEVFTDEVDGYTWCQWDEYGYAPMEVQPTHYHPVPTPPTV